MRCPSTSSGPSHSGMRPGRNANRHLAHSSSGTPSSACRWRTMGDAATPRVKQSQDMWKGGNYTRQTAYRAKGCPPPFAAGGVEAIRLSCSAPSLPAAVTLLPAAALAKNPPRPAPLLPPLSNLHTLATA
eukprot:365152-Chlamydomonas_euryale.AAC.14